MRKIVFEWDEDKDKENQKKHGVSFALAQRAFLDSHRVIAEEPVEKVIFCRLIKNAWMQGARNPDE